MRNFKKLKMSLYKNLDEEEINKQNRLIIQIDSITKLDIDKWYNTIIYLDEISCLLSYVLTSTTLKNKRVMIFNTLYRLLKQASYVLCSDADINDMVLDYFRKIGIKFHLIENKHKNINKIKAHEYSDKEILIRKMEQTLLKGEHIIACFDSKTEMDIVVERLKKFCEDNKLWKQLNNFLVYSSTKGDDSDFLIINDRWIMKNIFYTPKITIGVSFDNKEPRDVFLIALGNSINSFGYVQQISRCRNINELHYYVCKKYQELQYDSSEYVKAYYSEFIKKYDTLHVGNKYILEDDEDSVHINRSDYEKVKILVDNGDAKLDYDSEEWTLHDSIFNDLFYVHEYYDNVLRSAPREQFRWMLQDKGFDIVYINESISKALKEEVIEKCKIVKKRVIKDQESLNKKSFI
jgi:hypothetical protein